MAEPEDLKIPTVYVGLRAAGRDAAMPPTAEQIYRDLKAAAEIASAPEATDVTRTVPHCWWGSVTPSTTQHASRLHPTLEGIAGGSPRNPDRP